MNETSVHEPDFTVPLPSNPDQTRELRELRRSSLAPVIRFLYRVLNCQRRWRVGRVFIVVALRLEGGPMLSATVRELMSDFHGVKVGAYSYGSCFDPAIPRGITIGRYVSIAEGVRMFLQNHPLDRLSTHPYFYESRLNPLVESKLESKQLEIGHDVWIGCNAIITPGCRRIGDGAVIGAGAVVTKDVPDFAVVGGSPARRIKDRFSTKVVGRLLAAKWWLLPKDEVQARLPEFNRLLDDDDATDLSKVAGK